jgi:hypothetical protein
MIASRRVVQTALAGSLTIACIKFLAAALTGSSAMLSEAVHSLVDTVNELLLLYGLKRANRPPDSDHPLGYGREIDFWSFIVSLSVLGLGARASLYEGIGFSAFRARKGNLGFVGAFRASKDPSAFIVLLEDSAALIGLSSQLLASRSHCPSTSRDTMAWHPSESVWFWPLPPFCWRAKPRACSLVKRRYPMCATRYFESRRRTPTSNVQMVC